MGLAREVFLSQTPRRAWELSLRTRRSDVLCRTLVGHGACGLQAKFEIAPSEIRGLRIGNRSGNSALGAAACGSAGEADVGVSVCAKGAVLSAVCGSIIFPEGTAVVAVETGKFGVARDARDCIPARAWCRCLTTAAPFLAETGIL